MSKTAHINYPRFRGHSIPIGRTCHCNITNNQITTSHYLGARWKTTNLIRTWRVYGIQNKQHYNLGGSNIHHQTCAVFDFQLPSIGLTLTTRTRNQRYWGRQQLVKPSPNVISVLGFDQHHIQSRLSPTYQSRLYSFQVTVAQQSRCSYLPTHGKTCMFLNNWSAYHGKPTIPYRNPRIG